MTLKFCPQNFYQDIIAWYDQHQRVLPWRRIHPDQAEAYRVWMSEIMLQQTTVATVIPYYQKFIQRWPSLEDFARASLEEIRVLWQGLGYYSRALNMHRCAKVIVDQHQGLWPEGAHALIKLPGIGPYTAAAIASIAQNQAIVPLDGNTIRVIGRVFAIHESLPQALPIYTAWAEKITSHVRPGDYAQALMDLGSTVCTPRAPSCYKCPVNHHCQAFQTKNPEAYPVKAPKRAKVKMFTHAYIAINAKQQIALRRRPDKGLLAGLMEVPCCPWQTQSLPNPQGVFQTVRHIFTHIDLKIDVTLQTDDHPIFHECLWIELDQLHEYPLPTLTKKIIHAGLRLIAHGTT